jgi:hypothetical protein
MYIVQHCFICRPSDSTVSEDAGIQPRTVATLALAVRRSTVSTRLDLIHSLKTETIKDVYYVLCFFSKYKYYKYLS